MTGSQWLCKICLCGVIVLLFVPGVVGEPRGEQTPTERREKAAAELWRRGHCMLSSVVRPAEERSKVPGDLRGAQPISGRTFSLKVRITAWARDQRYLWAATDTEIFQVDLSGKRLVRSYCKADGLPDWPVDELLSDGRTLWIVHRRGLATLGIGQERVEDHQDARFRFARLHRDGAGVWVIADGGTYWYLDGGVSSEKGPAIPTGLRIRDALERGTWLARRKQKTAYLMAAPVTLNGRLYVASYGTIYELGDGNWRQVADEGWSPEVGHGCLWFLSSTGLVRYDPKAKSTSTYSAPDHLPIGRPTHLAVTDKAVWVAVEPREDQQQDGFIGGGLARLNVASGRWQRWQMINDCRVDWVTALEVHEGTTWAATIDYGACQALSAHPGMMHCKRLVPVASGLCLHQFLPPEASWRTIRLKTPTCENREILGQKGTRHEAVMIPRSVESIGHGISHLFAVVQMFPKDYYSGYYTSIDQLATRRSPASPWEANYAHHPQQLNLHGEQPDVLLISESHGKRVVYGVGHDRVCGVFSHRGQLWAVTEGCAAWFDAAKQRWQKVVEPGFHFYWKATAALDDGRYLWVGSDRGFVSRLDLGSGRFEMLAVLKDREITRISKDETGRIVVASTAAPQGRLPVQLEGKAVPLDGDLASFDGQTWTRPTAAPPAAQRPPVWSCESDNNFLWYDDKQAGKRVAKFYLTGVFRSRFLCASPDQRRIWLGTYSGLVRLDR